jgi:hypothetical protein
LSARTRAIADLGILQTRVRPGREVVVIDISAHGALIETVLRLLPGRPIELQIERSGELTPIRGRIVRSHVARVNASSVSYRGAIGFEKPLAWIITSLNSGEYSVLGASTSEHVR